MTYIVMPYIVMAYVVMAFKAMAYIVMACIVVEVFAPCAPRRCAGKGLVFFLKKRPSGGYQRTASMLAGHMQCLVGGTSM